MAKDKTKPRPELDARREAARKAIRKQGRSRHLRVARNILIAIVIIGLAATGVYVTVQHVKAGNLILAFEGDPNVTQITPPNATDDGLGIVMNPTAALVDGAVNVDMYVDYQDTVSVEALTYYGDALTTLADSGQIKLTLHLRMGYDATIGNHASGRANVALACADTIGHFWDYSNAIVASGIPSITAGSGAVSLTDDQLQVQFPATAGITGDDLTAFQTCYSSRATSAFVAAMDSGIQTTPITSSAYWTKGVTTVPVMLADNQTVDISSDLSNATASTADTNTVLQMVQYYSMMAGG